MSDPEDSSVSASVKSMIKNIESTSKTKIPIHIDTEPAPPPVVVAPKVPPRIPSSARVEKPEKRPEKVPSSSRSEKPKTPQVYPTTSTSTISSSTTSFSSTRPAPKPEKKTPSLSQSNNTLAERLTGFANLPNQLYRKSVKDGFEFSLMVVGESGLGKSTLINSLFLSDIYSEEYPGPSNRVKKTLKVEKTQIGLKESGVQLNLTIVDTPGFGDNVNNDKCWEPIQEYIDSQFELFLNQESRVTRPIHIPDTRVHVCLYFIAPGGHGLKPLDIEFMRRLHDKVNIIPLISKADTLTPDECQDFKKEILREINLHNINIYEFPDALDEEENRVNKRLKQRVPFAVIGSNCVLQINDRRIRARQYPWGVAEVDNEEHCDFRILRDMLVRTHMQDLIDVTSIVHYENYRAKKLANVMSKDRTGKSPLAQMEEEKREHKLKMKKMEKEMESVFETKVNEKKTKLKHSEAELIKKHDQQKKKYEADLAELEQRRREFEIERDAFEEKVKADQKTMSNKKKTKIFS